MIWSAAIGPLLWILRIKREVNDPEPEKGARYCVDTENRLHRMAWWTLNKLHNMAQGSAGVCSDAVLYQRLLNWGLKIPILGYQDGDLNPGIRHLGKRFPNGGRGYNVFWLSKPVKVGRFRVLKKHLDADGKVIVQCVWITGKSAGTTFDIGPNFSRYKSWEDKDLPAHASFPNRVLVVAAEVTLSASLLGAIIGVAEKVPKGATVAWQFIGDLWTLGANLLHRILH